MMATSRRSCLTAKNKRAFEVGLMLFMPIESCALLGLQLACCLRAAHSSWQGTLHASYNLDGELRCVAPNLCRTPS